MTSSAIIRSTDLVSTLLRVLSIIGDLKTGHCMPAGCYKRELDNELIQNGKPIQGVLYNGSQQKI